MKDHWDKAIRTDFKHYTRNARIEKFSAFGGVPSGPACSPVGIVPLWLGAFGERASWRDVGLLVVSGFAGGKSFAGEALFEFCW